MSENVSVHPLSLIMVSVVMYSPGVAVFMRACRCGERIRSAVAVLPYLGVDRAAGIHAGAAENQRAVALPGGITEIGHRQGIYLHGFVAGGCAAEFIGGGEVHACKILRC